MDFEKDTLLFGLHTAVKASWSKIFNWAEMPLLFDDQEFYPRSECPPPAIIQSVLADLGRVQRICVALEGWTDSLQYDINYSRIVKSGASLRNSLRCFKSLKLVTLIPRDDFTRSSRIPRIPGHVELVPLVPPRVIKAWAATWTRHLSGHDHMYYQLSYKPAVICSRIVQGFIETGISEEEEENQVPEIMVSTYKANDEKITSMCKFPTYSLLN